MLKRASAALPTAAEGAFDARARRHSRRPGPVRSARAGGVAGQRRRREEGGAARRVVDSAAGVEGGLREGRQSRVLDLDRRRLLSPRQEGGGEEELREVSRRSARPAF